MKKQVVLLILAFFCLNVMAQENYEEILQAYISTAPNGKSMSSEMLKPTLYSINQRALADFSKEKSDELVKNYISQQWQKDVISGLKPLYEKHLTIDELKELTELLATNEGQRFLRNNDQIINMSYTDCEELLERYYKAMEAGKKPKPIRIDKACSSSFAEYFGEFYDAIKLQHVVDQFIHLNSNMTTASEEEKASIKGSVDYITKNLKTLLLNNSYKIFSEQDLQYGIRVGHSSGWAHQLEVVNDLSTHAQTLGKAIIQGYLTWLQKQNVKLK